MNGKYQLILEVTIDALPIELYFKLNKFIIIGTIEKVKSR